MSSLEAVVRVLRWSAARSSAASYLLHALLGAAAWVLAVLVASRLVALENPLSIAALGVPAVLVALAVAWLSSRPQPMRLMRTADVRLTLHERLSTAWERRLATGPLDEALRRDALEHASRAQLARAYPVGWSRGEVMLTLAVAVAAIALFALPNPMDQVIGQRHADRAAQSRAASAIDAAKQKLAASSSAAPADPQIQQILEDTRSKIASAPDPRTALQAITPAEQKLLQLSDPQTPARLSSAQNLAGSLATTSAGATTAQALDQSPAKGAQALRNLASQLQSLSPEQRGQLAKALAGAAQESADPAMAGALQQASAALASGNIAAAALALNTTASQLDSLQLQMTNDQEIAAAINALEAARQQLAAQADRDAGQAAGGAGSSPAAGSVTGSSGQGSGNGQGSGTGQGAGNGQGSGNGAGGTGGSGQSGSGSGSGAAAQGTERVYVPAPPAPGSQESDPAPLGPGQNVPLMPYGEVIQAYQQAALDATEQSLIPGSEQDLIRAYFSSLDEPGSGQ